MALAALTSSGTANSVGMSGELGTEQDGFFVQ